MSIVTVMSRLAWLVLAFRSALRRPTWRCCSWCSEACCSRCRRRCRLTTPEGARRSANQGFDSEGVRVVPRRRDRQRGPAPLIDVHARQRRAGGRLDSGIRTAADVGRRGVTGRVPGLRPRARGLRPRSRSPNRCRRAVRLGRGGCADRSDSHRGLRPIARRRRRRAPRGGSQSRRLDPRIHVHQRRRLRSGFPGAVVPDPRSLRQPQDAGVVSRAAARHPRTPRRDRADRTRPGACRPSFPARSFHELELRPQRLSTAIGTRSARFCATLASLQKIRGSTRSKRAS